MGIRGHRDLHVRATTKQTLARSKTAPLDGSGHQEGLGDRSATPSDAFASILRASCQVGRLWPWYLPGPVYPASQGSREEGKLEHTTDAKVD
jgi:hypothetical protein